MPTKESTIILKQDKKKLLVICPYPEGVAAGQRLKYEQYFDSWRGANYELEVSSFADLAFWNILYIKGKYLLKIKGILSGYLRRVSILFSLKKYDVVYIYMWVSPVGTTLFERLIRLLSQKLIYDFDDFVHSEASPLNQTFLSSVIRTLKGGQRKTNYLKR